MSLNIDIESWENIPHELNQFQTVLDTRWIVENNLFFHWMFAYER